jgi:hypothetical protein
LLPHIAFAIPADFSVRSRLFSPREKNQEFGTILQSESQVSIAGNKLKDAVDAARNACLPLFVDSFGKLVLHVLPADAFGQKT